MLSKKSIIQLIVGAFLATSTFAFAVPQKKVEQPPHPKQFEGQAETGIFHYEGDFEDTLADPLDSTNEEIDEQIEDLEETQQKVHRRS